MWFVYTLFGIIKKIINLLLTVIKKTLAYCKTDYLSKLNAQTGKNTGTHVVTESCVGQSSQKRPRPLVYRAQN